MVKLQRSVTINASQAKIFDILDNPESFLRIGPGVTRVSVIQRTDKRIGDSMRLTYSVLGLRFPIKFTTTDHVRPSRINTRMEGGMKGTFNWSVATQGSGSKVMVDIDYQMRGGIIGKAMNTLLVERMNEKNTGRLLENLKMMAEAS